MPKPKSQASKSFCFFFHSAFDWVIASLLATLRRGFYSPCPLPWLPIDFEHLGDIVGVLVRPPQALRLEKHNVREGENPRKEGKEKGGMTEAAPGLCLPTSHQAIACVIPRMPCLWPYLCQGLASSVAGLTSRWTLPPPFLFLRLPF